MLNRAARSALTFTALLMAISLPGCLGNGANLFGSEDPVDPYDYLRDSTYTKWRIEVDATPDQNPRMAALAFLEQSMLRLANKGHVDVVTGGDLPSRNTWTIEQLNDLRDANQGRRTGGDTVVTYVAYVDGALRTGDETQRVLGLTVGHDFVVIFKEQVDAACQPNVRNPATIQDPLDAVPCYGGEERIEKAVLVHEFGHAIGLVNRGIPMVNAHEGTGESGERHSNNPDSIMYWAVDSYGTLGEFTSQIPLEFDANDLKDVCAAGGRC